MKKNLTIIGNSVIDVLAGPVSEKVFQAGSHPMERIKLSFGGDALNEAVILSQLGRKVDLISKIGDDESGARILSFLQKHGISTGNIVVEPQTDTSVNIVLVDEKGERSFLTNPKGSQRRLSYKDVLPRLETAADIISFASIFVSADLDIPAMTALFREIKKKTGRILVADMTKAKNGERLEDLRGFLPYIDYLLPNAAEAALLTGTEDPFASAEQLVKAGVSCAVIKCGAKGCVIKTENEWYQIPAYPVKQCIDTTGAGDCFAAGFLWALSEGMELEACGRFACAAASCAVEYLGATDGGLSSDEVFRRYVSIGENMKSTLYRRRRKKVVEK